MVLAEAIRSPDRKAGISSGSDRHAAQVLIHGVESVIERHQHVRASPSNASRHFSWSRLPLNDDSARSFRHAQISVRRVDRYKKWPRHMRERGNRLARSQRRQARPEPLINAADSFPQRGDHLRVGNLVEDERVDETQHLPREMLRQLGDEDEAEPSLSAALGDLGDLLKENAHLVDAVFAQKFVRFFDDDQRPRNRGRFAALAGGFVSGIGVVLSRLDAGEHVGDHNPVQFAHSGVRQIDDADGAGLE
jgi:hypothetical protein